VWATAGFPIGFLAAGAMWLVAGVPFPIPTRVPAGVLLLLTLPYGVLEAAGHAIDDTERQQVPTRRRFSPVRLALVGVGIGLVCLPLQFLALWAVAPREWAFVVVWLVFPLVVAVALGAIGKRLVKGRGDPDGPAGGRQRHGPG
jgi:hypothetical protein